MSYEDIIGYDEIIGATDELDALDATGFDELVVGDNIAIGQLHDLYAATGAAPAKATQLAKLAQKMGMAREIDPRAVAMVNRAATRRREYPIGFASDPLNLIPSLGGTVIQANPQVSFRGERLVVPSDISLFFDIEDIIVGKNSQLVSSGALPAATFSEVGVGVRLNLDTANIGNLISLRVRNIGPDPLQFRATLIGTAVE